MKFAILAAFGFISAFGANAQVLDCTAEKRTYKSNGSVPVGFELSGLWTFQAFVY